MHTTYTFVILGVDGPMVELVPAVVDLRARCEVFFWPPTGSGRSSARLRPSSLVNHQQLPPWDVVGYPLAYVPFHDRGSSSLAEALVLVRSTSPRFPSLARHHVDRIGR